MNASFDVVNNLTRYHASPDVFEVSFMYRDSSGDVDEYGNPTTMPIFRVTLGCFKDQTVVVWSEEDHGGCMRWSPERLAQHLMGLGSFLGGIPIFCPKLEVKEEFWYTSLGQKLRTNSESRLFTTRRGDCSSELEHYFILIQADCSAIITLRTPLYIECVEGAIQLSQLAGNPEARTFTPTLERLRLQSNDKIELSITAHNYYRPITYMHTLLYVAKWPHDFS